MGPKWQEWVEGGHVLGWAVNIAVNNVRCSSLIGVGTLQGGIALTGVQSI